MSYRELFQQIMFYGEFDRMPVCHWTGWTETMARWRKEGLPEKVDIHKFFGTTPHWTGVGVNLGLWPAFPERLVEENADWRIYWASDGVLTQAWKSQSCIPHYLDFTLKTAKEWPEYKKRLQPDPARIPKDLDQSIARVQASGLPITVSTASLMGWVRNWMGVVNLSFMQHDDPDCFADMVQTLADLTCWGLDQVLPKINVDMGFGWEDICGRNGPLVSPKAFARCVAPGYRQIRNKLESYGVKLYGIDSDGDVGPLLRQWLEAGVNVQFPIEVGTWKADGLKYRQMYGKDLRIFGHFDKLTMERGQAEVLAELERLRPLMKAGGFIILPDHLITPGVSLDMYRWYLDQVRAIRL